MTASDQRIIQLLSRKIRPLGGRFHLRTREKAYPKAVAFV